MAVLASQRVASQPGHAACHMHEVGHTHRPSVCDLTVLQRTILRPAAGGVRQRKHPVFLYGAIF
jgi:hypothetical protein